MKSAPNVVMIGRQAQDDKQNKFRVNALVSLGLSEELRMPLFQFDNLTISFNPL